MAEGTHPEQRAGASRWQRASRLSKLPSPARPCQALTSPVKPCQALSKLPRLSAATRSGAELTVCCHCFDSSRCASSSWRRWGPKVSLFLFIGNCSNRGITISRVYTPPLAFWAGHSFPPLYPSSLYDVRCRRAGPRAPVRAARARAKREAPQERERWMGSLPPQPQEPLPL